MLLRRRLFELRGGEWRARKRKKGGGGGGGGRTKREETGGEVKEGKR